MPTIKSLKDIKFDALFLAFKEAFKDYEMQLEKNELHDMLNRRGFSAELSFGAFDKDKLVAFTFNGIGFYNQIKTAYDTGTGTIESFRGQGLATKIFKYSIPFLKNAHVENYLLEVLQHNTKAVGIYKNIGFKTSREFNYFVQKIENIQLGNKQLSSEYQIKPIHFTDIQSKIDFCDFVPSWQNSLDAISRTIENFKLIGAFYKHELIGYCILEPASGDISQIAVAKNYRRKGIGSNLLREIIKLNHHDSIKVINTPIDCYSISNFLKSKAIEVAGKQFEMRKKF